MENKNFFCEITKSEMGYNENVFLYFSIMDELCSVIAEIQILDTEYKSYGDLIEIVYRIPDYEYRNINILENIRGINPDKVYNTEKVLSNCDKTSILLYRAYSKSRIALHYFVELYNDERFNKLFNDENLTILKNVMKFFLSRFYEMNGVL